MSASRKNTKRSRSNRTKNDILKELEVTQRLLIEKEEELVLCQEELAHILQNQSESPDAKESEFTDLAQARIEAFEAEISRLESELVESKSNQESSNQHIETLQQALAEEQDGKSIESDQYLELESELAKNKESLKQARAQIKKLQQTIDKAESHKAESDNAVSEELEAKSRQLEVKSKELETKSKELETKSEELETKSKELKVKSGELEAKSEELEINRTLLEDANKQIEELQSALDQAIEAPQPPEPQISSISEPQTISQEPVHTEQTTIPKTIRPTTVPIKIAPLADFIEENQPFTVSIDIDMDKISETSAAGFNCRTRLFAKRISDGWSSQIGENTVYYQGNSTMIADIEGLKLEGGVYRLQATASFTSTDGSPLPIAAMHEGELIQVV